MTLTANESMQNFDIAIVGGGMVGVTAALLLSRRLPDARICLLERVALDASRPYQPSFDQRSTAIAAGSFEALAELDLLPSLMLVSGAIRRVEVTDRGHWGQAHISAEEQKLEALGWVVPNAALGQCLLGRLAADTAIHCLAPAEVRAVRAQLGGYRLHTSEGELHTQLLILADGADDSALKQSLGLQAQRRDYGQRAVIANVRCQYAHQGRAFERFTDWGPMALLPLANDHEMALVWTLDEAHASLAEADDQAFLAHLQSRFGDRMGRFEQLGRRDSYPLALVQAREQIRSHLLLLGNAAHFLHPVAGQGFNLSVRDLACLAEVLADGRQPLGSLEQLEHYLALRASDQWLTTAFSHQLVHWFSSSDWLRVLPRQLGLMLISALPSLKHALAQQSLGRTLINRPAGALYRAGSNGGIL